MAPETKPASKGSSYTAFLKKKGPGGIPIWAYTVAGVLLAYLLYRWYANRTPSSSSNASPASDATQPADLSSPDSGGGSGGDLSSPQPQQPQGFPYGYGGYPFNPGGEFQPAVPRGANPSATTPLAGAGGLEWGGTDFTTRAAFDAYLKSKSLSVAQFAARHPAAYAEYLALPAGVTAAKGTKKPTTAAGKTNAVSSTKKVSASVLTARKAIATVLGGDTPIDGVIAAKPTKAIAPKVTKAPLSSGSVVKTLKATSGGNGSAVLAAHSLSPVGQQTTVKKTPAPVKAPAKSTVKPAPAPTPVAVRPSVAKPPAKKKK